jgi:hypothetical protein
MGGVTFASFVLSQLPPPPLLTLEELDEPGGFGAAVAGRVLHHVHPLGPALDKLAALAPLVVVDEFAWNHIDDATRRWYESRHRELATAGREPKGPSDLDEWRWSHPGLVPFETVRAELDARYDERHFEWRPYFHRWLGDEETERIERERIAAGAIRPIGYRYVGVRASGPRSRGSRGRSSARSTRAAPPSSAAPANPSRAPRRRPRTS